jgi:hypothetical protein
MTRDEDRTSPHPNNPRYRVWPLTSKRRMTMTSKKSPVVWIGKVGVRDGKIINSLTDLPIPDCDLPLHGISKKDAQLTNYGRLEKWEDRAGHVFLKTVRGKAVEWVPMHGRKATRPKRLKIDDSAKRGETMFDPAKYVVRP